MSRAAWARSRSADHDGNEGNARLFVSDRPKNAPSFLPALESERSSRTSATGTATRTNGTISSPIPSLHELVVGSPAGLANRGENVTTPRCGAPQAYGDCKAARLGLLHEYLGRAASNFVLLPLFL